MSPDQLTALAAECEARAKAGEKPVMEWDTHGSGSHVRSYPISTGPCPIKSIRSYRTEYCIDDLFAGDRTGKGRMFSSLAAAQLFVDAILAHATAPLHAARIAALETQNLIAKRIGAVSLGILQKGMVQPEHEEKHAALVAIARCVLDGTDDPTDDQCDEALLAVQNYRGRAERAEMRIAELEAERAGSVSLRPMAEAPRDGTKFLAWHHHWNDWVIVRRNENVFCPAGGIGLDDDGDLEFRDFHFSGWLPLPEVETT